MNPLEQLPTLGQSPWYDNIERRMFASGELARLIADDGLRGVTSNPSIFEKAIAGSADYDAQIRKEIALGVKDPRTLFFALAIEDIRAAADLLMPTYRGSGAADGYVSLEVSPDLAHDADGTVAEAMDLWARLNRSNAMIKVPATSAGVVAFERLTVEGINVNVTLLFSVARYQEVLDAWLRGLETRLAAGLPVKGIASVASFFVSRVDHAVDAALDQMLKTCPGSEKPALSALKGKIAIANARMAYAHFKSVALTPRWQRLHDAHAQPQRLLWASTGTKNPAYSDVCYVDELIGPQTVNTIPPATWNAFRDHGSARRTLDADLPSAQAFLTALARHGIALAPIAAQLEHDGVAAFAKAFNTLLAAISEKVEHLGQRAA
jgi:transaldolase